MRLPACHARRASWLARLAVALLQLARGLAALPTAGALAGPACLGTNLSDSGGGSLRQCLLNVDPDGTIEVQGGVTGTITLLSDFATLTKAVTLIGPGANLLTI